MIVSRPFQDAMRGVGRNALDLPVAALAAVAAAFVVFALPADLLSGLVAATGLPSVLPAAEAPLGLTARIVIGLAGAAASFGLVFALLRVLDRSGLDASRGRARIADDEAPRRRRRDAHPDAPERRPISAARDLGEPAPPVRPREAATPWCDEADAAAIEAAVEAAPEPEPKPEPTPEPAAEAASSLPELMERLERGLARRRAPASAPAPQSPPQVFPEAGNDRLQSAIDSLQRLASRQS